MAPLGGTWRFRAPLAAGLAVRLQVRFQDEQATALGLARQARDAALVGDPALSLTHWGALLASAPWDAQLVDEAMAAIAALEREGLVEIEALRQELEHARFFRLSDIFVQIRDQAHDLAARYAGSAVEPEAARIEQQAALELAGLVRDEGQREVLRLRALHVAYHTTD